MQFFILLMILAVTSFEYLINEKGWLPQLLKYTPEILGLIATVCIVSLGIQSRFRYVRPIYWLVFGGIALIVVCGALANLLPSGPIFAGLRTYLWALPFFFLPAVYAVTERQLRLQLLLLAALVIVQLPLAFDQRMATEAAGAVSGDSTVGTVINTTYLTLFQLSAACVLTGFFLRKRIPTKIFLPLLLVIVAPTMLNESKGALIIFPVAMLTLFFVESGRGKRLKNFIMSIAIVACFGAIFIPVYDHFMKPRWGYGIVDFFLMEGRLENYLDRGAEIGTYDRSGAGKAGSIRIAVSMISDDPVQLVFGLGIGNVSDSSLGQQFQGKYFGVYGHLVPTSIATVITELGLMGVGLVFLLYWCIFRDCIVVARRDQGIMGALAVGWSGAVIVLLLGFGYHSPIKSSALSALFWYFSGLLAAHRARMELAGTEADAISFSKDSQTSAETASIAV